MRLGAIAAILVALVLPAMAHADASARAALRQRVPEAKLIGVSLADAMGFIRDVGGLNIDVNWKALEAANIGKDTPINLNLHDVRLATILSLTLKQAGPGGLLTWYIDKNVVEITTQAVADSQMIVIVYDVRDLIDANQPFDPTITNSFATQYQGTTGQGGGGSGNSSGNSSIFANASNGGGTQTTTTEEQRAQPLIKLIERVIRPEIWKDNGGNATIEFYNGDLIVRAPRSVQEAIGGPVD